MKELVKIVLSKKGEPRYTTYFYHKSSKFVYEVISNGTQCAIALRDDCNLREDFKHGSKLPKYIKISE